MYQQRAQRRKLFFVIHSFKQKYIIGLVHKENLQNLNQCEADSVKRGKLTSPLETMLCTTRRDSCKQELPPSSLNVSMI